MNLGLLIAWDTFYRDSSPIEICINLNLLKDQIDLSLIRFLCINHKIKFTNKAIISLYLIYIDIIILYYLY